MQTNRQTEEGDEERERERDPTKAIIMWLQIGHWGALFLPKPMQKNSVNAQHMLDMLIPYTASCVNSLIDWGVGQNPPRLSGASPWFKWGFPFVESTKFRNLFIIIIFVVYFKTATDCYVTCAHPGFL